MRTPRSPAVLLALPLRWGVPPREAAPSDARFSQDYSHSLAISGTRQTGEDVRTQNGAPISL